MPLAYFLNGWTVELRFPFSRELVDDLKSGIPACQRSWDPDRKVWTVFGSERWANLAVDFLLEAFPYAKIVRPIERPIRQTATASNDPYRALHLLPTAPPELVKSAYRTLSKLNHPDHGGDTVAMQQLNGAYAELQKAGAA